MRFKIILENNEKSKFLPITYQYYISAWIYKRIGEADKKFAQFLHEQGYGEGNRRFKFFNFNPLYLNPYRLHKERGVFELLGNQVSVQVSFFLPEIAEPFIKGLFLNNQVFVGDRINGVHLNVREVQVMPNPAFAETMNYHVASPCCVTRPPSGNEQYAQYLSPKDNEFVPRIIENLKVKYATAKNIPAVAGDLAYDDLDIDIKILTREPKSKLITIKPFTEKETKIRGWLFDCQVTAPTEVQDFIWDVGLGEKGSLGFGFIEISKND